MTKSRIAKGTIITNQPFALTFKFKAKIMILNSHSTTIKLGYQPVINCKTIVQSVKFLSLSKEVIRGGELAEVEMRFVHHPEFISEGDMFIFREGNLRGVGKIFQLL
jgi:GTPase